MGILRCTSGRLGCPGGDCGKGIGELDKNEKIMKTILF
jgi:hypothetical protein